MVHIVCTSICNITSRTCLLPSLVKFPTTPVTVSTKFNIHRTSWNIILIRYDHLVVNAKDDVTNWWEYHNFLNHEYYLIFIFLMYIECLASIWVKFILNLYCSIWVKYFYCTYRYSRKKTWFILKRKTVATSISSSCLHSLNPSVVHCLLLATSISIKVVHQISPSLQWYTVWYLTVGGVLAVSFLEWLRCRYTDSRTNILICLDKIFWRRFIWSSVRGLGGTWSNWRSREIIIIYSYKVLFKCTSQYGIYAYWNSKSNEQNISTKQAV